MMSMMMMVVVSRIVVIVVAVLSGMQLFLVLEIRILIVGPARSRCTFPVVVRAGYSTTGATMGAGRNSSPVGFVALILCPIISHPWMGS